MTITVDKFAELHNGSQLSSMRWAAENCADMQAVWQSAQPRLLVWVATRQGVLSSRELRLFAVQCARAIQRVLFDRRSVLAIRTAERFANGEATLAELELASEAAEAAKWARPWDAACYVAAACATVEPLPSAACKAATAAVDALYDGHEAMWESFAAWLRANCQPNFSVKV